MLNAVYVDVLDEQSRGRALNSAWHQLYLLGVARLPLDVVMPSTGHLHAQLAPQCTSVIAVIKV